MQDPTLDITYEQTRPFIPPIKEGKVIKVYDGDTITIAAVLFDTAYRFPVRLFGIDCPELKGSSPEEKQRAIKARDDLSEMVLGKMVRLENVTTEKYGRLLAEVYLGDINLSTWMLEKKHAYPYFGGTKSKALKDTF